MSAIGEIFTEQFLYQNHKKIHLYKTAVTLMLTYLIGIYYNVPHSGWATITVVVLLLPYPQVGDVARRSLQRSMGTAVGAIYGIITLFLFHGNIWLNALFFIIAVIIFSEKLFKKFDYATLTGLLALTIVFGASHSLESGLWRCGQVIIGSIISYIAASIMPIKAQRRIQLEASDCIAKMNEIYKTYYTPHRSERPKDASKQFRKLTKHIVAQRKSSSSAINESKYLKAQEESLDQFIVAQRLMAGALELLWQTQWASKRGFEYIKEMSSIEEQQTQWEQISDELVADLRQNNHYRVHNDITVSMSESRKELHEMFVAHPDDTPLSPVAYVWLHRHYAVQLIRLQQLAHQLFEPQTKG
ncbi:FUSC family protein [Persicobacter psychrovividus]|uniref:Integral membrane bound transporter domain-containing protein n=1 Tax=Persicobacter psychrovividus TaxID=387638 RepID=A0ABM7VLD4_9BACT|nr:hypothetical protein PEPS_40880 [Persicobacter psychrovividus]